jgi:hypothetical protein
VDPHEGEEMVRKDLLVFFPHSWCNFLAGNRGLTLPFLPLKQAHTMTLAECLTVFMTNQCLYWFISLPLLTVMDLVLTREKVDLSLYITFLQ